LLYVHPKAPQKVKDFARYCLSEQGANVAEGLGFITPREHFAFQAQKRLAELRRETCPRITACADGRGRKLLRDLALAYTKDQKALALDLEASDPEHLPMVFAGGMQELMLSSGIPDGKYAGERWKQLQQGQDAPATCTPIGARVAAVVVNAQLGKTSLSWQELCWILSGTVRDWRALNLKDGVLEENEIQLLLPERKDPITRLLTQVTGLSPGGHAQCLESDEQILAEVSANPAAIGIVLLAEQLWVGAHSGSWYSRRGGEDLLPCRHPEQAPLADKGSVVKT
jgi:hypothetical protein